MGYKIAILDPSDMCCAKIFSDIFIKANFDDFEKVEELCKHSDVITFEFENIDADALSKLEKKYNKKIVLNVKVDKKIIGGGILKIGNEVINGSIKNQIEEIKKNF